MHNAGRIGDCARSDDEIGPAVQGSANVLVNRRPVLRTIDIGIRHASSFGEGWQAIAGAATVLVNDRPVHRIGDPTSHSGKSGQLVKGSLDVAVGDRGGDRVSPKIHVQVIHEGGVVAAQEPYKILDDAGVVVHSGTLNDDGILEVFDVKWRVHSIQLTNGWTLRLR